MASVPEGHQEQSFPATPQATPVEAEKKSAPSSGHKVVVGSGGFAAGTTVSQTFRTLSESTKGSGSGPKPMKREVTTHDEKVSETFQKGTPEQIEKQKKIDVALNTLVHEAKGLSAGQMMQRLNSFNGAIKEHWDTSQTSSPSGALFNNIKSPEKTRIAPNIHANWLDDKKTIGGFMYPTNSSRPEVLATFMENGITSHTHLANDFAVWLLHDNTGPLFPMSSETFKKLQGERSVQTEIGEVKATFGEISSREGKLFGSITVSGMVRGVPVKRTLIWPLDSTEIKPGLRMELVSKGDRDVYQYKDSENRVLHTLEVNSILWKDFDSISPTDLHKLASRMLETKPASAGCRAGVGRTGTLFVAAKMLEWAKANPQKELTNDMILRFIAEGRVNRDQQLVQTESQMALLLNYKNYLNSNPELSLGDRMQRLQADLDHISNHVVGKSILEIVAKHPDIKDILTNPNRPMSAADEALVDMIYEALVDPISQELIKDPVLSPYGHTFEKETIEKWLTVKQREHRGVLGFSPHMPSTCPLTREPLTVAQLQPDVFVQRLLSLLLQRGENFKPATVEGKAMMGEVERLIVKEPIAWCRLLSTMMPQNSYFVRRKGIGGENDFVLEYRGAVRVQKCGFRVNAEGKLQPLTPGSPRFASVQDLVNWLSSQDVKHRFNTPPQALSKDEIVVLNNSMGKGQFLENLHRDESQTNLIRHLEQRFEEEKVSPEILKNGFVRASILPCSFPCFTHVRLGKKGVIKQRCCLHEGRICSVKSAPLKNVANVEQCREMIRKSEGTELQKQQFLAELEKVKDRYDFSKGPVTVTLFVPSTEEKPTLPLAQLNEAAVKKNQESGYMLVLAE